MKKFSIKEFNKLVQMSDIASINYLKETLIENEKDFNRNCFLNHLYNSVIALNNCIVIMETCIIELKCGYYCETYRELKLELFMELGLDYNGKKDKWVLVKWKK